jgi:hypothetical protein
MAGSKQLVVFADIWQASCLLLLATHPAATAAAAAAPANAGCCAMLCHVSSHYCLCSVLRADVKGARQWLQLDNMIWSERSSLADRWKRHAVSPGSSGFNHAASHSAA